MLPVRFSGHAAARIHDAGLIVVLAVVSWRLIVPSTSCGETLYADYAIDACYQRIRSRPLEALIPAIFATARDKGGIWTLRWCSRSRQTWGRCRGACPSAILGWDVCVSSSGFSVVMIDGGWRFGALYRTSSSFGDQLFTIPI